MRQINGGRLKNPRKATELDLVLRHPDLNVTFKEAIRARVDVFIGYCFKGDYVG